MSNSKPFTRKTTIDLMRQEESDRKKLFGLQRQSKLGITTVNTGNIGSGGSSGSSGGGVSAGDNLGNHIANQVLNMTIHQVKNVQAPTECNDAVTKCYVDDAIALLASINGLDTGAGLRNSFVEQGIVIFDFGSSSAFVGASLIEEEPFDGTGLLRIRANADISLDDIPEENSLSMESISEGVTVVELEP